MARFRVKTRRTVYEYWDVEADNAIDAADRFGEGDIIKSDDDDPAEAISTRELEG